MCRNLLVFSLAAALQASAAEYTVYRVLTTAPAKFALPSGSARPAYYKNREGQWAEAAAAPGSREGVAEVSVEPAMVADGNTMLVINKPDWVVLDDTTPPAVVSVSLNAAAIEDADEIRLDAPAPLAVVRVTVVDRRNRIAPSKCSAWFDRARAPIKVTLDPGDSRKATLSFVLPERFGFGLHTLALRAGDEAPEDNVVERRFTFRRFGVEISGDGRSAGLHTAAASFTCPGTKQGLIHAAFLPRRDVRVALTGNAGFLVTEGLKAGPELVVDEPDHKVLRVRPALFCARSKQPSEDYDFVLDLEIRRGFPGLLVTSRATATRTLKKGYKFWSEFHAGDHYIGSDGKRGKWHPRYAGIGPQGWLYLPPVEIGSPGYGLITNGRLEEYLGDCALIFTKPKQIRNMEPGQALEVRFALVPATGPKQVAECAKQIAGWLGD